MRLTGKNRTRVAGFGGTILLVFIIVILRSQIVDSISFVQSGLVRAGTSISVFLSGRSSILNLSVADLAQINERIDNLAVDYARLITLEKENTELKNALHFSQRQGTYPIGAWITARTFNERNVRFNIDKGTRDGVFVGAPVIVSEGFFVGHISNVKSDTATVSTVTDAQSATAISLLNASGTIGIASGLSGNLLTVRFIPIDKKINVNDLVVTSGLEEHIPPGLIVGFVNDVYTDEKAPFQQAIVEPSVVIGHLNHVIVLIPENL